MAKLDIISNHPTLGSETKFSRDFVEQFRRLIEKTFQHVFSIDLHQLNP